MRQLAGMLGSLAVGFFMTAAGLMYEVRELVVAGFILVGAASVLWLVAWGKTSPAAKDALSEGSLAVGHSVSSHNQSGGITAHTVNTKPPQRTLTDKWGQKIIRELAEHPKTSYYQVGARQGDDEAYYLAEQVRNYMVQNGYSVSSTICAMTHFSPFEGHKIGELQSPLGETVGPVMVQVGRHPEG